MTPRDAATVSAWTSSKKKFHCIRDHPSHARYAVSAGMWGAAASRLRDVLKSNMSHIMNRYCETYKGGKYIQDQLFTSNVVWPLIKQEAYCSDSVSCDKYEGSHPFPVARIGWEHVGQVFMGYNGEPEVGRAGDIKILKNTKPNAKCVPAK